MRVRPRVFLRVSALLLIVAFAVYLGWPPTALADGGLPPVARLVYPYCFVYGIIAVVSSVVAFRALKRSSIQSEDKGTPESASGMRRSRDRE